jgi:hypothetical protein
MNKPIPVANDNIGMPKEINFVAIHHRTLCGYHVCRWLAILDHKLEELKIQNCSMHCIKIAKRMYRYYQRGHVNVSTRDFKASHIFCDNEFRMLGPNNYNNPRSLDCIF